MSKLLSGLNGVPPNFLMLVVSDTDNPYYNQIYSTNIQPKYRISELTVDKINEFAAGPGRTISIALNTLEEYQKITQLILESNFIRAVNFIELKYIEPLIPLFDKLSSITTNSSGAGICGNIYKYRKLNQYLLYDITTAVLVNSYKIWRELIKNFVISTKSPDFNISVVYDVKKINIE